MSPIEKFFRDLDAAWRWPAQQKVRLRIIGSAALMLQTNYHRGTKDSDVLETLDLTDETQVRLLEVAGRNSKLYNRTRMYLDIVGNGIPFLPKAPQWQPHPSNTSLRHFDLEVLDVVDVVVSKLKRFHANDIGDIAAMIDRSLVPHARVVERFNDALDLAADFLATRCAVTSETSIAWSGTTSASTRQSSTCRTGSTTELSRLAENMHNAARCRVASG